VGNTIDAGVMGAVNLKRGYGNVVSPDSSEIGIRLGIVEFNGFIEPVVRTKAGAS
jgi:hypothetical protein